MGSKNIKSVDKEIKVLVLTSTFPRWLSDTEPNFVFELSKNLVKNGFFVDVIAPHALGAKSYEEIEGLKIYRYQYFLSRFQTLAYNGGIPANLSSNKLNYLLVPFFFFFQFISIVKRLRKEKYDLIHAHWLIPQTFIAVLVTKYISNINIPILCTSHGADLYRFNSPLMNKIKRWVAKSCFHMCVVSKAMKSYCLTNNIRDEGVSVLSMGVDIENLFIPISSVKRMPNRLIFVGRFVHKKGISVLIEALRIIVKTILDVELLLVGDGPLYDEITEMIENKGLKNNVKFYGSEINKKLPELYSSASIAVVPSIVDQTGDTEGLGLVTIEAMGCECAVVASSLEPIKEVIENEKTGILFPPGDSEQLAKCVIELLNNHEKRSLIAKQGRKKSKQKYDWQIITRKYYDLISAMC